MATPKSNSGEAPNHARAHNNKNLPGVIKPVAGGGAPKVKVTQAPAPGSGLPVPPAKP